MDEIDRGTRWLGVGDDLMLVHRAAAIAQTGGTGGG